VSTPGQDAYEGYWRSAGGRSAWSGDELPPWDEQSAEIRDHWEAAAAAIGGHPVLTEFNGARADKCEFGDQLRHHTALRFVWHHILPKVCGGKTEPGNLKKLCDNCHAAVHVVMYQLSRGGVPDKAATAQQFTLANIGYELAVAAGTQGKIPKESAA
jgi:hypothetical protein